GAQRHRTRTCSRHERSLSGDAERDRVRASRLAGGICGLRGLLAGQGAATLWPDFRTTGGGMQRRQFLGSAALAGLMASLPGIGVSAASRPARVLPPPLMKGDTVALVSPSSATDHRLDLQLSREVMEALGFRVKTGAHYAGRRGHLAGSDEARAADLNGAFADDQVKAVICVRGGSGAARVLPFLG